MPLLPEPRQGQPLIVRGEALQFSFWPMRKGERRWGLHSMVYAADPWAIILDALHARCAGDFLRSALSFVRQAQEYFRAAERSVNIETRPVLYYYSFLNLVKALGLANRMTAMVGSPKHGIVHNYQPGVAIQEARLVLVASQGAFTSVFDSLHQILTGRSLGGDLGIAVSEVMAQSVIGHRLWREASNRRERSLASRASRCTSHQTRGKSGQALRSARDRVASGRNSPPSIGERLCAHVFLGLNN